jgi:hypothetical protein
MELYGADRGLNMSKVKLKFFEEGPKAMEEYKQTLDEISQLRSDYLKAGGTDLHYLRNLDNLE